MKKATKRIGRPTKEPAPGARVMLGLRVTADTKNKLDQAAKAAGRSQSQEAELRLEQSFTDESAMGGPEITNMVQLMKAAFMRGGQRGAHARKHPKWTPDQWLNDPFAYEVAVLSVIEVLFGAYPPDPGEEKLTDEQRELRGKTRTAMAREVARGNRTVTWTRENEKEPDNG
jgi:hypothetical protein